MIAGLAHLEAGAGRPAVVLLSGGLDSTTTLALAIRAGWRCYALSFDYGQRHRAELDAAAIVAATLGASQHRKLCLDVSAFAGSALTDTGIAVPETELAGIPPTYVPARNTVFLALALAWAETLGASDIFIGANALDYSGYPDCRPDYLAAFEAMANLATKAAVEGARVSIRAPLINLSKAQIVSTGLELGLNLATTVSCYQADADGRACGRCDSCRLRKKGFAEAGQPDPTRYRD